MQYDGFVVRSLPHRNIVMTNDSIIMNNLDTGERVELRGNKLIRRDKYGNILKIDDRNVYFESNAPSYDELYEYWIKTKKESI